MHGPNAPFAVVSAPFAFRVVSAPSLKRLKLNMAVKKGVGHSELFSEGDSRDIGVWRRPSILSPIYRSCRAPLWYCKLIR